MGLDVGNSIALRVGVAAGISSVPVDALILFWGQSHAEGPIDAYDTGSGNTTGGDGKGMQYNVPFEACRYNHTSALGPGSPMNWNTNTGTEGLQTYAPAGQLNCGAQNAYGRFLVRHGLYHNPAVIVCAIGSTSIPGHWLPSSNFPASGEKVYAHLRDFCLARQTEFGRKIGIIHHQIGETDAGTQARIDSCVVDYNTMYTALLADLGIAKTDVHIFITLINPATSGNTTLNNAYRDQQVAWVAQWVAGGGRASCAGTDGFWLPLESGTHYRMNAFDALGNMFGLAVRDQLFPGRSLDISSGPYAWFQGNCPGYSAQASPNTSRPLAYPDPHVDDVEVLVAHGNGTAHVVSLVAGHDAGFVPLIAQTDSVSGASHRSVTVWIRVIDQLKLDARPQFTDAVRRGPCETPQIDFGVATLNFACIYTVRGADPANPVAATSTGANNAGTTSVSIGTLTTTNNNSLIMFATCTNGLTGQITAVSNPNLTSIGVPAQFPAGRDHQVNPGAGTINMAMTTAQKATAGAIGSTNITFGASSLNVGCAIAFNPKP
jgi:hypothetical protein